MDKLHFMLWQSTKIRLKSKRATENSFRVEGGGRGGGAGTSVSHDLERADVSICIIGFPPLCNLHSYLLPVSDSAKCSCSEG